MDSNDFSGCFLIISTKDDKVPMIYEGNIDKKKIKGTRNKSRKDLPVIYPIFNEISVGTDDIEWIDFCNNASKGVFFNRNFKTDGNFLSFKIKSKIFKFDLNEKYSSMKERFEALKDFVSNNSGFFSNIDMCSKSTPIKNFKPTPLKWQKDVGSNENKKVLINIFVDEKAEELKMNSHEKKYFHMLLQYNIFLGYINSSDIIMDCVKIVDIQTLRFEGKIPVFTKTKRTKKSSRNNDSSTTEDIENKNIHVMSFSRTLNQYEKKLQESRKTFLKF